MTKKYILKPGRHQFAPGSAAIHSHDNLNDEEAKWYLEKYPHIAGLFIQIPRDHDLSVPKEKKSRPGKVKPSTVMREPANTDASPDQ